MDVGHLFTWHAATPETAPKFAQLREAELAAVRAVRLLEFREESYGVAFWTLGEFAGLIEGLAPECEQRTAAILHLQIARGLLGEAVTSGLMICETRGINFRHEAARHVIEARLLADAAVACANP